LTRIQKLERLCKEIKRYSNKIEILCGDYFDVPILNMRDEDIIIYLDPPYRNTATYKENSDACHSDNIDYFFKNLPYTSFMSEYDAPFSCIHGIETRSTFSASSNNLKRIEKLYINR
jgi:site-specific DNA-adenine methylase